MHVHYTRSRVDGPRYYKVASQHGTCSQNKLRYLGRDTSLPSQFLSLLTEIPGPTIPLPVSGMQEAAAVYKMVARAASYQPSTS